LCVPDATRDLQVFSDDRIYQFAFGIYLFFAFGLNRVFRKPRLVFGAEFRAIFHNSDFAPASVVDGKVSKFRQSGLVFSRAFEEKCSTKTLTHKRTAFPRAR
jgi:hypothetical protein